MNGSLNSMNYLKPYGFINKVVAFFKTRHTADIETQYGVYSVRVFDFHIDFTEENRAYFRYEGIPYKTFSVYSHLNYLNKQKNAFVRIILEDETCTPEKEIRFQEYCSTLENIYKDIVFFGGYREKDLKQIYKFKNPHISQKIYWYDNFK